MNGNVGKFSRSLMEDQGVDMPLTMKCDALNSKKPRRRNSRPESHRRRLERLLKQILAGKVSIHAAAEMASESPPVPYRRVVE